MLRCHCTTRITAGFILLAGGASMQYAPAASAASAEALAAAHVCVQSGWVDKSGYARAQAYREQVNCLKRLYIRVATDGLAANARLEQTLNQRLDQLQTVYYDSRNICRLREKLGLEKQGCGTDAPSVYEFVRLLKRMIVDADAGWVRHDPGLVEALQLERP